MRWINFIRPKGPVADIPIERVQRTFDTNLFGVMRTVRAVMPHMAARKSGIIVNVGSVVGEMCVPSHLPLTISSSSNHPHPLSNIFFRDVTASMALTVQRPGTGTTALPKQPCTRSLKCSRWNASHSTSPSSFSLQGPSSP